MGSVYRPTTTVELLAAMSTGKKLVTGEKTATKPGKRAYKRFVCELDGEPVSPVLVRGLIGGRLVKELKNERTARTKTWAAAATLATAGVSSPMPGGQ